MIAVMSKATRLAAIALLVAATGAVALPQRTAFANTTTTQATQTSLSSGSETTPGPSLTRSCGFWLPNEIFLNSWWTEHATFTVATEMNYYIQYNNTLVLANSTSQYNGFTASFTATEGENSGKVNSMVYTDFDRLATMGVLASMQWEFPGVPTDLISLLPSTTKEFTYAETRLHTYSEITTEWGISATRTKTVVASPTPYAEPILGILDVKYLDESGNVVEATNYTDLGTLGYTGGIWSNSTVDWPSKVYFDSIPPDFIEWVQRNASVSSQFPWLSECTNFVSKRPTGAPTVHVVVSTLTHTTSSIIATRPENFGGAVPVRPSKTTTDSSVQKTSGALTSIPSTATCQQTTATTSEETSAAASASKQTSTANPERTSPTTATQGSTGTDTLQTPSPSGEPNSSSIEQFSSTASHESSTGSEQTQTPIVDQFTSAEQVRPTTTEQAQATVSAQPISFAASHTTSSRVPATTDTAGDDVASALSPTGVPIGLPTSVTTQSNDVSVPTTLPDSAVVDTGLASVALPVSNAIIGGGASLSSDTNTVSNAVPQPSATKTAADSDGSFQVSSSLIIPTNGQVVTSGAYSSNQEGATQIILPSNAETPIAIAPILTLGSTTIIPNPSTEYIIGSQTLAPGGPAITVGETAYSLASSVATLETDQSPAPAHSDAEPPQITLGSSIITLNPSSGLVYASQTLSAGGSGIVVAGNRYSLVTSGTETALVQNGLTSILRFPSAQATQSVSVVHIIASAVASDGAIGARTTLSGTLISGQSPDTPTASPVVKVPASALITTSTSIPFSAVVHDVAPVITIGSSVITHNTASEYVIEGQTLVAGGSAIQLQGTTYSLAASATAIIINGTPVPPSASQATEIVVAGQTLRPGESAIQVQGTTYSLASSGNAVVINGQISSLSASTATTTITTTTTPVSVKTVSVGPGGEYVVGGKTFTVHTSGSISASTSASVSASASSVDENGEIPTVHTLTSTQGTEVVVWSGLLTPTTTSSSTSLSESNVSNSGSTTTSPLVSPSDSTPSTGATASTAGASTLAHGGILTAVSLGISVMFAMLMF